MVTWLMDGSTIREHGQYRAADILLEGNSGYQARSGYDRYGNVILALGPEIFKEFEKFLQDYHTQAELEPEAWDLVFRAFQEDTHWLVEPEMFEWVKDSKSSRFTYNWSLPLRGYRRFERRLPRNVFSPISDNFLKVAEGIRSVGNLLAVADNVLTNVRTDMDAFREPVRALLVLSQGIDNVIEAGQELLRFPVDAISDLVSLTDSLVANYEAAKRTPDIFFAELPAVTEQLLTRLQVMFEDSSSEARSALGRAGGNRGSVAQSEQRLSAAQGSVPVAQVLAEDPGSATYQVREGQSLKDIAEELYGSRDRWTDIAQLNNMATASSYSDGTPMLAGDILRVAGVGTGEAAVSAPIALRRDLEVRNGDLTFEILEPTESAVQLIRHRLGTVRGDCIWSDFGIPDVTGLKLTQRAIGYVSSEAIAAIEQDPRVTGVKDVEVLSVEDTLNVSGTVILLSDVRASFRSTVTI